MEYLCKCIFFLEEWGVKEIFLFIFGKEMYIIYFRQFAYIYFFN